MTYNKTGRGLKSLYIPKVRGHPSVSPISTSSLSFFFYLIPLYSSRERFSTPKDSLYLLFSKDFLLKNGLVFVLIKKVIKSTYTQIQLLSLISPTIRDTFLPTFLVDSSVKEYSYSSLDGNVEVFTSVP